MRPFDKFFKNVEKSTKKIKIKMIQGKESPEEHEKFLKDEPMVVKVTPEPEKKAPPKRRSEVVKVESKTSTAKKAPPAAKTTTVVKLPAQDGTKVKINKSAEKAEQNVKSKPAQDAKEKTVKAKSSSGSDISVKVKGKTVAVTEDNSYTKDSVTVKEGSSTRNGKFDIQRAKDGRFFFNLYASNHTVIAYSQIYSSTAAAMTGIKSIIANAATTPIEDTTLKKPTSHPCPKWEIYIDKAGEYRFRLYASNGLCVCHSAHGYSTKSGCKGGIDSIGRFASDAAKIDKSYLK